MEIIKETKEHGITQNREAEEEMGEIQGNIIGQTQLRTNSQKDNGNEEERIMRKLLQEWKNLDESFIPETQKQLYKETFEKYKEKKGSTSKNQMDQTWTQGTRAWEWAVLAKGVGREADEH